MTVYEKSLLATLCDLTGRLCFIFGAFGAILALFSKDFLDLLILVPVVLGGFALSIVAENVNKAVVKRKLAKSLTDKKLINYIQKSAIAAYALFKNDISPAMLGYINTYNPYAANMINQYVTNAITEDVLIGALREYDVKNGSEGIWNGKNLVLYSNSMFTLRRMDMDAKELAKQERKYQTKRTFRVLFCGIGCGILFIVLIFLVCVMIA